MQAPMGILLRRRPRLCLLSFPRKIKRELNVDTRFCSTRIGGGFTVIETSLQRLVSESVLRSLGLDPSHLPNGLAYLASGESVP